MSKEEKVFITVSAKITSPVDKVWEWWTNPIHIMKWNNASPNWHTPKAVNDLNKGGLFNYRMESIDGTMGFDFSGRYELIELNSIIEYKMDDGRNATIHFIPNGNITEVIEIFEAEDVNSLELQKAGWQSILDNFKKYTESL